MKCSSRRAWPPLLGTIAMVMASCTLLQPPAFDPPSTPSETPPARADTAWYLGSTEREAAGGVRAFRFTDAVPTTPVVLEFVVDNDDFAEIASWDVETATAAPGKRFDTSIQLEEVTGVALRWRLLQVDGCGRIEAASAYSPDQRMEGTYDWVLELDASWQVGDQLRLSLEARRIAEAPVAEAALAIESPGSAVYGFVQPLPPRSTVTEPTIAPIDPGPVVLKNLLPMSDNVPGTSTVGLPASEFRWTNQRVYWWNQAAGRWDGILPTAQPPAEGDSHWWLWQDLGGAAGPLLELSTTTANSPDVFWDEGCATLHVFFSRGASGTSRSSRLTYDPTTDTYFETTARGGVKVPEGLRGSKRVTITKTANGYLWAAVNHDNRLLVSRSIDGGDSWAEPIALSATAGNGDTHWVSFRDGAEDRLAVIATEEENANVRFYSLDPASVDWDEPTEWLDETQLLPGPEGDETADDSLSAIAFEDWVFFVIETVPGPVSRRTELPQLVLYARSPTGDWSAHVLNRFSDDVGADRRRPVITIDAVHRQVIVGAGRNSQTTASLFVAPIDDLDTWQEHILFDVPTEGTEALQNIRLPRQPVTGRSRLLVLVEEVALRGELWRQVVEMSPAD